MGARALAIPADGTASTEVVLSGCPVVVLSDRTTGQLRGTTGQPVARRDLTSKYTHESTDSSGAERDLEVVQIGVVELAELAGVSRQAVLKAVQSGRIEAVPVVVESGRRAGRTDFRVPLAAAFTHYPQARAAYEARQAAQACPVATPEPRIKRDPQQVVLRANPEALQRARQVQLARLRLLEQVRILLADLGAMRRSVKKGLPGPVRQAALAWLLTSDEAEGVRQVLGEMPSTSTLNRWWAALAEDPSGEALRPLWSACGRPRKVEQDPQLLDKIAGAFAHSGSFALAAEYLQKQGTAISEATLRRVVSGLDPAIRMGLRFGARKSQTDLGPYVRRRPSLPFQCWSIDGHTEDSMWRWDVPLPGETLSPFRPTIYTVRDVGSGALLAQIVGQGLNRYLPFMAIAMAILQTGVIPETIQSDNGSEVKNRLFMGDDDTVGYFAQLGMGWKDGEALWRGALPYNSRSKPVERDFLVLKQRFSAMIPTYTGGNPSARPGDPLNEALKQGHVGTIQDLRELLETFREAELDRTRTLHGRKIHPRAALEQAREQLIRELGPDHPRFVRPGAEWRVLPGLKARKERGAVTCRIEGQVLRYDAPVLHTVDAEGLTVRISPWDLAKAWLCRGGELLDTLTYIPDGPALGDEERNLIALRIMQTAKSRQVAVLKRAELEKTRIRQAEGFLIGRPTLKAVPQAPVEVSDLTDDQLHRAHAQRAQLGLPEQAAPVASPEPELQPLAPQGRAAIKDRLDWCRYMLTNPEDADEAERRDFQRYLDQNPLVRQQLGIPA